MTEQIKPFDFEIGDAEVADLRERLARTRWPETETATGWQQGVPSSYMRELCAYWSDGYDMDRLARRLGSVPQFTTEIDGLSLHFVHRRSGDENAIPLIVTHGWPSSVLEFLDVVGPLTGEGAASAADGPRFHLVYPSLPGYGFSQKPESSGWGVERIAGAYLELMARLGYGRFIACGGDWGAPVAIHMAAQAPESVGGLHLSSVPGPLSGAENPTELERQDLAALERYRREDQGYAAVQSTRPQTLAYGLTDSPAAQCAWIVEKFGSWSDSEGDPENVFDRDELLDNVMLYWLTRTGGSSGRLYWESFATAFSGIGLIEAPSAYSVYPHDIFRLSERLARTRLTDLRRYRRLDRGGHFPALEVPDLFVEEVRASAVALGF